MREKNHQVTLREEEIMAIVHALCEMRNKKAYCDVSLVPVYYGSLVEKIQDQIAPLEEEK